MSRTPSFSGTARTREGKEGEKALVMSKIPRLRLLEAGLRAQECSLDNINQSIAMLLLPSLMSSAELGRSCRGCFDSRISLRLSPLSPSRAPVKTLMSPCEMCPGWRGTRVAEGQGLPGPWAGLHRDQIPAGLCQLALPHHGENPLWVQRRDLCPRSPVSPCARARSALSVFPKLWESAAPGSGRQEVLSPCLQMWICGPCPLETEPAPAITSN